MARAGRFFTKEEKRRIEEAVVEAESKTSAEIVPAIATDSGRYDRAEDVAGLWLGLIAMAIMWWFLQGESAERAMWGSTWSRFELPVLVITVVVGFVVGAILTTYSHTVRRLFTPQKQMLIEVQEKANHIFYDKRIHHTEEATGLLIYISLYEHAAVVLGDQTILEKLGQPALDKLCEDLVEGIKQGDVATALCECIRSAGDRLAAVLPSSGERVNQIENTVIIAD